ncbi:MAG TPA: YicC/YloC family endoribonuclease [Kofleriaceae bacterium]|nr:YicC/YloC family endoribonuclease [Kofleriaceae bacterium]
MTGYGRGVAVHGAIRATVDVRAVNHRFLDLKLRGAPVAPAIEEAIATRVRSAIERGAVTVAVHLAREGTASPIRIDQDAARRAYDMLAETALALGLTGPDLALVLAQPGVVVAGDDRVADDPPVVAALDAALAQLDQMRANEGTALATELGALLDELTAARVQIAAHAAAVPQQLAKRLDERVRRLVDDPSVVDPARLAQEIAMLADRADVTEELVRLASHLDQVRALLAATGPTGRRLDFLVQEIGRELNTIGSKSALAEISTIVVAAKAVLEKIREQVQNVE